MSARCTIAQPELDLLLACARTPNSAVDGTAIREMLARGIDWSVFARKAISHGVASLVGVAYFLHHDRSTAHQRAAHLGGFRA